MFRKRWSVNVRFWQIKSIPAQLICCPEIPVSCVKWRLNWKYGAAPLRAAPRRAAQSRTAPRRAAPRRAFPRAFPRRAAPRRSWCEGARVKLVSAYSPFVYRNRTALGAIYTLLPRSLPPIYIPITDWHSLSISRPMLDVLCWRLKREVDSTR